MMESVTCIFRRYHLGFGPDRKSNSLNWHFETKWLLAILLYLPEMTVPISTTLLFLKDPTAFVLYYYYYYY
jgi:hypothetical protein